MSGPQPTKLKVVKDVARKDVLFAIARVLGTQRVYVGSSDFKVHEIDLAEAKPTDTPLGAHDSYVTGVVLAGKALVSGSYDGKLIWWDLDKRSAARTVDAHPKWIRGLAISPDGSTIASVADDMVCRLWDATTGKKLHDLRGHPEKTPTHFASMLYVAAFSADGKHLATGDRIGTVLIWETATGKQVGKVDASGLWTWDGTQRNRSIGGVRSLAFSADGKTLAAGGVGKIGNVDSLAGPLRVEVFDWAAGKQTHVFQQGNNGLINFLAFHPKDEWLMAVGGGDNSILFFDLKTKKTLHQMKAPMFIHAALLDETQETLYAAGHNKIAVLEMKG
jgi:WD40 repeat protein